MRKSVSILIVSAVVLTSCGAVRDSRVNPFNWFGKSTSVPVATTEEVNPLIPQKNRFFSSDDSQGEGVLIDQIAELAIEHKPGGAIIRARGVADQNGFYSARLFKPEIQPGNGVLLYEFRIEKRASNIVGGSERARSVTAARRLTTRDLAEIRTIRVRGARNERVTRR